MTDPRAEFMARLDAHENIEAEMIARGMLPSISDAMVERAARALAEDDFPIMDRAPIWEKAAEAFRDDYRGIARRALTAALTTPDSSGTLVERFRMSRRQVVAAYDQATLLHPQEHA